MKLVPSTSQSSKFVIGDTFQFRNLCHYVSEIIMQLAITLKVCYKLELLDFTCRKTARETIDYGHFSQKNCPGIIGHHNYVCLSLVPYGELFLHIDVLLLNKIIWSKVSLKLS